MWDTTQQQQRDACHPPGTVQTVASRDERRHGRHTKRSGGVRTTKLGAVQRRVLVKVFHLAWDKAHASNVPLADVWVDWKPKQQGLMPNVTREEASSLSKALVSLEERRLMMVRRHDGGRAYAVRLTVPGYKIALELIQNRDMTIEQRRQDLAKRVLDRRTRAAAPIVQRELRRSGLSDEQKATLQRFDDLYELVTGDPEDRGTGNYVPGINATPQAQIELLRLTEHLIESNDAFAHLRS